MWPFKKRNQVQDVIKDTLNSVLCIPGNWNNREEFILSIVSSTGGEYINVGNVLLNAKLKQHYAIEFCERDERMYESFKYAGKVNNVSEFFLEEIGGHKYVIYISAITGSLKEAENIALAGLAILKSGGIGIKVETAGKAFEKDQWAKYLENFETSNLYDMFVLDSIVYPDGSTYSCGMHNIGFKDTIISGEEFQDAVKLIRIFSFYQIVDSPTIHNNQTFSIDSDSPRFRITNELSQPNEGIELFENPFGLWKLSRV
jgi:hypothetical protein